MKIKKRVMGHNIVLKLEEVKRYSRYTLYDVYEFIHGEWKFLYKECYDWEQIARIVNDNYWVVDEVFS